MKRDPELIRKLLFFFEEKPDPRPVKVPPIDGYTEIELKQHLVLLAQAGLIDFEPVRSTTSDRIISVIAFDLTWEGHEFLEVAREDNIWLAATKKFAGAGGGIAIDLLIEFLKAEARARLGIPL